jgi:hypothetical protein
MTTNHAHLWDVLLSAWACWLLLSFVLFHFFLFIFVLLFFLFLVFFPLFFGEASTNASAS